MTKRPIRRCFAARPTDPNRWIRAGAAPSGSQSAPVGFTARLTVDITPELRGQIKIAAFRRGVTVADMLRELLAREFPPADGDAP